MANQSFDTTVLHPLERPLSSDLNAAQSELHRELRDYLGVIYSRRASNGSPVAGQTKGFIADGFRCFPAAPGLAVTLTRGMGFASNPSVQADVGGIIGLNDLSTYAPLVLSDFPTINLNAAPGAGFARVDLIQAKVNRRFTDTVPRDRFNAGTLTFNSVPLDKTLTFDLLGQVGTVLAPAPSTTGIGYKVGTTFAYPANDFDSVVAVAARPAVDAGYIPIAYINVKPGAAAITAADIIDVRPLLMLGGRTDVDLQVELGPDGTAAGFTIPNIVEANLPPGMTMNVLYDTSVGPGSYCYYVYLFCGDTDVLKAQPFTTPSTCRFGVPLFNGSHDVRVDATVSPPYKVLISAGEQAALANPAIAAFVQNVAIGQPCFAYRMSVESVVVNAGAAGVVDVIYGIFNGTVCTADKLGANTLGFKLARIA